MKSLRILILALLVFTSDIVVGQGQALASSQDECAIWLCLPSGFPSGCSAAHSAMINRLKSRKPPLPAFSSCASEGSGRYKIGVEQFEPCKDGYELQYRYEAYKGADCVNMIRSCIKWRQGYSGDGVGCPSYAAIKRPKPHFIDMWANGEYIGKFFYQ